MGTRKNRNGMVLTEEEDVKKRWQENTEELCKKDLHDPDNHTQSFPNGTGLSPGQELLICWTVNSLS